MRHFSFFTALENRSLAGKSLGKNVEQQVLMLLRTKACQAATEAGALIECLCYLEMAAERSCPYSSFILGCLYLGAKLRKPNKPLYCHEWYNLFNGSLQQELLNDNKHEFIDLTQLEQSIQPDYKKAEQYFNLSASLQNPQAFFWLSRLALDKSADLSKANCYAIDAVSFILRNLTNVFKQFQFEEIIYLSARIPNFAVHLLNEPYVVQFLLESDGQENNIANLYILLTTNLDVVRKSFNNEQFLAQFNPYQKSALIRYVLRIFPDLYDDLTQVFNFKKQEH